MHRSAWACIAEGRVQVGATQESSYMAERAPRGGHRQAHEHQSYGRPVQAGSIQTNDEVSVTHRYRGHAQPKRTRLSEPAGQPAAARTILFQRSADRATQGYCQAGTPRPVKKRRGYSVHGKRVVLLCCCLSCRFALGEGASEGRNLVGGRLHAEQLLLSHALAH